MRERMTNDAYVSFVTCSMRSLRRLLRALTREYRVACPPIVRLARYLNRPAHVVLNALFILLGLLLVLDPMGIAAPLSDLVIFIPLFLVSLDRISPPRFANESANGLADVKGVRRVIDLWVVYSGLDLLEVPVARYRIREITGLYWIFKVGLLLWLYLYRDEPELKRRPNPLVLRKSNQATVLPKGPICRRTRGDREESAGEAVPAASREPTISVDHNIQAGALLQDPLPAASTETTLVGQTAGRPADAHDRTSKEDFIAPVASQRNRARVESEQQEPDGPASSPNILPGDAVPSVAGRCDQVRQPDAEIFKSSVAPREILEAAVTLSGGVFSSTWPGSPLVSDAPSFAEGKAELGRDAPQPEPHQSWM